MEGVDVFSDGKSVCLKLASSLYPYKVILTTAYTFLDRAYVLLDGDPSGIVQVTLEPKDAAVVPQVLQKEFQNALLGYVHFHAVSEDNRKIREMIVYRALMTMERSEEIKP